MNKKNEKLVIGLPVYNGEKTIRKTLDSILNQTFSDFKLVISDNNSTDDTMIICKEYGEKNSNIVYHRQKENIGALENFKFVLNYANSEYFIWIAADDWWEPTFLEKNVSVLEVDEKYVGSISKINYYDINLDIGLSQRNSKQFKIKKFYSYEYYPKSGKYSDRVSFYLRLNRAENIYSLFRTDILKRCIDRCMKKPSIGMDSKILLLIQKYGEINLLDDILMHRSGKGSSSKNSLSDYLEELNDYGLIGKFFPYLSFSIWILKNSGLEVFFRTFDYILLMNYAGIRYQIKQYFVFKKRN